MEQKKIEKLTLALLVLTALVIGFNTLNLSALKAGSPSITGSAVLQQSTSDVIPTGVPKIYGSELSLSYDDVSPNDRAKADAAIRKMSDIDRSVTLTGNDKERYIDILYRMEGGMSCEYCCGARSIIFENGEPACGCAHSFAMRGLTKYLITEHGDEYTDAEILEEIGKWKTLYFPTQMTQKASVLKSKGIEFSYINLASNKNRGIEKGAVSGGGMVGGC